MSDEMIAAQDKKFKFVVKLKLKDLQAFENQPLKVSRELSKIEGYVNIEKAFFNHRNKLLYLCTNEEGIFNYLQMWPETAFNKGVEIIGDKP